MTSYLIDSDVFIQAKNMHYGFDIVPAFWAWLDQAHAAGTVYTVDAVAKEVSRGGDDLAVWMKTRPPSFKLAPAPADQTSLQQIAAWANTPSDYTSGAIADFLSKGDYFLTAQGHSLGYTVVTHEVSAPTSKANIKIPDACNAAGVPWMNPFQMLKAEGARFVL